MRLVRSAGFRFVLLHMAIFGVSVALLLVFLYASTQGVIVSQTNATIAAEVEGLADTYRTRGIAGLAQVIARRSVGPVGRRGLYLLTDVGNRPIAGNLSRWPPESVDDGGWVEFQIRDPEDPDAAAVAARARVMVLPGDYHLLVGRDMTERIAFEVLVRNTLVGLLILTLLTGLVGGWALRRLLLRRLDAINRISRAILTGHMDRRVEVRGTHDEFDQIAQNLNAMLDRIGDLMKGMREVSDNIAHDMRSPISRMRSRLEVLLMSERENADYRQAIEQTIAESDRILATFNALLGIAEAESGAPRAEFKPVDIGAVVRDAGELYEAVAEDGGVALQMEVSAGVTLNASRHLLFQAVGNLLDNAVKYTPRGGHVRLSLAASGDAVEIVIADDGPGIPAADRERVFQRFARLEASRTAPGSGLGLSLARAVARLHGGDVVLASGDRGGLRACLRLPKTAAA